MDRAGVEAGAKMFVALRDRFADCAKITAADQFFETMPRVPLSTSCRAVFKFDYN
jgi:hypothetical protein